MSAGSAPAIRHRVSTHGLGQFHHRGARGKRRPRQLRNQPDETGVLLSTTEHLLAAIYSCGIDNVFINIDSIEVPSSMARPSHSCRCSSKPARAVCANAALLESLEAVGSHRKWPAHWHLPRRRISREMLRGFRHPLVGKQQFEMHVSQESFRQLLARARYLLFRTGIDALGPWG